MASGHLNVYQYLLKDLMITSMKEKPFNFRCFFRKYSNRPRLSTELNADVLDSIEKGNYKPKRHAGIIKNIHVTLPQYVVDNIHFVIKDHPLKSLAADGIKLNKYLHSRHLPSEEEELKSNLEDASLVVERKYNISTTDLTEEERQAFRNKYRRKIKNVFQQRTYSWNAVDYDDYQSKVYLIGRSSADYAVVNRVFQEMKTRLPNFKPKTLFDFGSGVGTVTWAAKNFWEDSLQEYFCVDSSASMNDLASSVVTGEDTSKCSPKGFFYRQFLPVSHTLKYDLVVSAFSLFELPNLKARLETLLTLWKKTQGYLVIIEQGTNAGFQVINETRDFIMEFCNVENSSQHAAHVFAPCPHDEQCPRFSDDRTPCNFEIPYSNPFYPTIGICKERFSYVILKKGFRSEDDPQWPRIVRPVLPRSKHVVCRMCTSAGKLEEIVFTASKHGKITYKCARASRWGDLLPISIKQMNELVHTSEENETKLCNEENET